MFIGIYDSYDEGSSIEICIIHHGRMDNGTKMYSSKFYYQQLHIHSTMNLLESSLRTNAKFRIFHFQEYYLTFINMF